MKKNIITPEDGYQYFFGYYDLQPYSTDNAIHLTNRVAFKDRLPTANDINEIGYIDLKTKRFVKISESSAWNFQQGSLMNWLEQDKSVIFNDFDGKKFVSKVYSLSGSLLSVFDKPIATSSGKTMKGISINFPRIYDFRPGYGYCNIPDKYQDVNSPKEDGIFLLDLKNGESKLLVSYLDMKKQFEELPFTNAKLVVNHINFSPSGEKFVFLLRNFPENGKRWGTVLGVGDLNGNLKQITKFETNSHYSFKDDKTLMIYSGLPEWGVYFIDLETGERTRLNNPMIDCDDIHVNYSPDKSWFIGDGYPDSDNNRTLFKYTFANKKAEELIKVYSEPVFTTDIRCDLHARFSPDGSRISYDTTENHRREIMEIKL